MIARKYLIPLRREFLDIKNPGKFLNSESLSLIVAKNHFDYPRFAIIVGKKVSRSSVVRHRIKRRIASECQKISKPGDYVFIVKKEVLDYEINRLITN